MPGFSTPRHYLLLAWLTAAPSSVGLGWAGKLTWDLIPLLLWLFWVTRLSTDCTLNLKASFGQDGLPLSSLAFERHLCCSGVWADGGVLVNKVKQRPAWSHCPKKVLPDDTLT